MKLKDYIKKLQDISKKHPNIEVAYSSDDEGNSYDYVWHNPAVNTVEIDGEDVEVVTINWFFIDIYKNSAIVLAWTTNCMHTNFTFLVSKTALKMLVDFTMT